MEAIHETEPYRHYRRGGFTACRDTKPTGASTDPALGFRHHQNYRLRCAHAHGCIAERRQTGLRVEGLHTVGSRMESRLSWRFGTWSVGKCPLPARTRPIGSSPSECAIRIAGPLHNWRVLRQTELTDYERGGRNRPNGLDAVGSSLFLGTVFCRRPCGSQTCPDTRTSLLQETMI